MENLLERICLLTLGLNGVMAYFSWHVNETLKIIYSILRGFVVFTSVDSKFYWFQLLSLRSNYIARQIIQFASLRIIIDLFVYKLFDCYRVIVQQPKKLAMIKACLD